MSTDPSPFPHDPDYRWSGGSNTRYIGLLIKQHSELTANLIALRHQLAVSRRQLMAVAVIAVALAAWNWPLIVVTSVACIALGGLVIGGMLYLVHRDDPEMGVK